MVTHAQGARQGQDARVGTPGSGPAMGYVAAQPRFVRRGSECVRQSSLSVEEVVVETIIVERADRVVTVTLNRPQKRNALTTTMVEELLRIFADVEARAEDRVLVLSGAGGAFCSGADLSGPASPVAGGTGPALVSVRRVGEMAVALHRLTKPTIAQVDGVAVGAGLGLALGCDLVAASERTRMSMIFSKRALSPDAATSWLLPRLVGAARAKQLAFFATMLDAPKALELGLVNTVVPVHELGDVVGTWARTLASGPALALSTTKELLSAAWTTSLADAVEHEARCQAQNLGSPDVKAAMAAFRQEPSTPAERS